MDKFSTYIHAELIFKVGMLALIGVFIVFLIIIIRQVQTTNAIVSQTFYSSLIQAIAIILLISAILLFIVAFAIL